MTRVFSFLFGVLFYGATAFLSSGQDSVPEKKIDRRKVTPNFTEGIIQEGSSIFTYVDKKRIRRLTLDVYRPEVEGPHPAIILFFGGGWKNGRPGLFTPLAQALAQKGYVCIVPEYRLSTEAPFPAAVHDAKAAIRWTRKNAEKLDIDADKIATMGGSAGGHLAAFTGSTNGMARFEGEGDHRETDSTVQASIVMCGPVNMLAKGIVDRVEAAAESESGDAILDFMGGVVPSVDKSIYIEASPLTHLNKNSPPMLFIDGENDRPRLRYPDFWKKMDELGLAREFVEMPDAPHPFWVMREWFFPTVDAVDAFLTRHFKLQT